MVFAWFLAHSYSSFFHTVMMTLAPPVATCCYSSTFPSPGGAGLLTTTKFLTLRGFIYWWTRWWWFSSRASPEELELEVEDEEESCSSLLRAVSSDAHTSKPDDEWFFIPRTDIVSAAWWCSVDADDFYFSLRACYDYKRFYYPSAPVALTTSCRLSSSSSSALTATDSSSFWSYFSPGVTRMSLTATSYV